MSAGPSSTSGEAEKARTFQKLVEEEIPIQAVNLPINGGLPSCVTLMDNFLMCFGECRKKRSKRCVSGCASCLCSSADSRFASPSTDYQLSASSSPRSTGTAPPRTAPPSGRTSRSAWPTAVCRKIERSRSGSNVARSTGQLEGWAPQAKTSGKQRSCIDV